MISIDDYVSLEKPTHADYEHCLGIDLTGEQLDRLVELLPRMHPVSISTLLHTTDLDRFCRDMLAIWQDYVNIEIWSNSSDDLLYLVYGLDVKIDFLKSE